jgi:phage-related protein
VTRNTRPISWIKAARKEFEKLPDSAQSICLSALTIAAEGEKADLVKPMLGLGSGVFEIALPYRGDAYGIKTPKHEVELLRNRLKALKEVL